MPDIKIMPDICPECKSEVKFVKDADWENNKIVHTFPLDEQATAVLDKYKVPFRCKSCRSLKFPLQATLDRVFVFPDPPPAKIGSILIPEYAMKEHQNEYAVVISVGKGYVDKGGRFVPTTVVPGCRVLYDRNIMWHLPPIEGDDGKMYEIKYMGEHDILAIVKE